MRGGTGSVLFEWRRGVARFMLKAVAAFIVVLLVVTAIGSDVNVKRPDRTVKIEQREDARADRADAARADPTPAPSPTPPSAAADEGKEWSVLTGAKQLGLLLLIAAAVLFGGLLLVAVGMRAVEWVEETRPPNRQQPERDRSALFNAMLHWRERREIRERERLSRDVEIPRLQNEIERLKREGRAPLLRGQETAVEETAPEYPHPSTNGAGPLAG